MAMRWKAEYATGIALLDRQHEEIFERAERLLTAMTENRGDAELGPLVGFLLGYVRGHLRDEEALMAGSRYPNLAVHLAQHTAFEDRLARIEARLTSEGAINALVVEVATFVTAWLRRHIATTDQVFARYLARSEALASTVAPPREPEPVAPLAARAPEPTPSAALPERLVAEGFEEVELPPLPPDALRN